jgi:hypothetical protein
MDERALRVGRQRLIFSAMIIEKSASTVFTPLEDSNAVLLNLDTLAYYKLNTTGAAIWEQIEKWKVLALDDLLRVVSQRFEVSQDEARRHLRAFLYNLEDLKMVRLG